MSTPPDSARRAPGSVVPAATILLLRDGAGVPGAPLEVFMVVRHHEIDSFSGALVFPGGKLEAGDASAVLARRAAPVSGLTAHELGFRIAAIREAYEETGVLIARPRGSSQLVAARRLADLEEKRAALNARSLTFEAFAEAEDLELAVDCLIPFAHWITPKLVPKRFDTLFYLAAAPADQLALHDGRESVESTWISPRRVLDEADEGKWTVIFPTRSNIQKLARASHVTGALETARSARIVTVEPWVEDRPEGKTLCIPKEADYAVSEVLMDRAL